MRRLAAILALCATPFMAQANNCAPSISVILGLDRWGEVEIEALERDGIEWRMWLNEVTGSWSLTGTKDRPSRTIWTGHHYRIALLKA